MTDLLLHEVGPRDGLQMERSVVPTDVKESWIRRLMTAGVDIVQVGSFVHPEKVPQMADTDELFRRLVTQKDRTVTLSGLVLNEKGLERGLACGVEMFCMGASASETHSRKNTGMSTDEALRRIIGAARQALAAGVKVQVSVQSAFGCGFEGPIAESRVLDMVGEYLAAGLANISLADTAGHAHPAQVERLYAAVRRLDAAVQCTCHFHNTYGLGMANIFAALRAGATSVETSFAGLGGCPFTKVAAGNVATEDFVHALQRDGLRMDVNLERLIGIARDVAAHFGRDMQGFVHKTGPIPSGGTP
ncbi:MAG: hydroxymethylglutaryl-CoA lyase [Gemmatimonadota bacterium]|nr:hydroxymethylglutaryl-CoA lyase [Gemmatimonadota bacterium]MDH4350476.1 hydroxymethylglutaryl-CoA lyase [Gemmatimonadota bacterium]MDH5199058.1 hydroxymethylglutaryl-CoA lyase [Gemmatimonadota bacterium]